MLDKLTGVWAPKPSAGPHKSRESLPLIIFLRNRMKYALTGDEVKMIYVPQYEPLNIVCILEQARKTSEVNNYLPEDRDMHKVPRQWLINVAF